MDVIKHELADVFLWVVLLLPVAIISSPFMLVGTFMLSEIFGFNWLAVWAIGVMVLTAAISPKILNMDEA